MNDELGLTGRLMLRARAWVVIIVTGLWLAGCVRDAGTGGTGEMVVPRQTLRQIDGATMDELGSQSPVQPTDADPATRPATAPVRETKLTIAEIRSAALANNLQLKVDLLGPTIFRESISAEQAAFESVFTTDARFTKSDEPGFSAGDTQRLGGTQSESVGITPGISLPLRTGGDISLTAPFSRFEPKPTPPDPDDPDPPPAPPDATYTSDLAFSISHPLLRGAGTYVNTQQIRAAFYQYQQTEARTKLQVITTLVNADRAYWRLYAALRLLEVREKEYELAVVQLERARRQVRAEAAAEVEVVRAEAGVADAVQSIINARIGVEDRNRELKRIINMPGLEMATLTLIIPASEPNAVMYDLDRDRLVDTALSKRMELLETELQIALDTSSVAVARNGLLPLLSFDYQYRLNGFGNAPSESYDVLNDVDFEGHSLGLRLEVPIGNERARSNLRQALARRLQSIASKSQRIELITFEVLNAAQNLDAAFQRILAARRRVVLNARLVDQEVRQFNLGLRTSTEVLQAQANLANAQSTEIAAITEYQIAQVDIAFATGTVLGAAKVDWQPATAATR